MGLLSGIFTLPLAPVRGVTWVAEQMKQQAERQYYDLGTIQRQLADTDEAYEAGEISERERDAIQDDLLARLFEAQRRRRAGEM